MSAARRLADRIAVVTGGSGTLGRAMARALAAAGAHVTLLARNPATLDAAVAELADAGPPARGIACDVTAEASVATAVDEVLARAEGLVGERRCDILVNAAGGNRAGAVVGPGDAFAGLAVDDLRGVIDLNLLGTILPCRALAPALTARGAGCVVNVSSMAASRPMTRVVGYAAAKAAVDNFTRWLAVEFARKYGPGLRVNAIAPGFFLAEQNRALLTAADGSLTDRGRAIVEHTPAGRFGRPDELASTLLWLCDPASTFVTGVVVPVDGGFSAYAGV